MPTHIHLVLKQLEDNAISVYMNNVLNSYTRYFNIRHKRKGPLWEGRFKKVWVVNDEQLLHLTRYIHLNPVTSNLIEKPEQWGASSYQEYLRSDQRLERVTCFEDILDITPREYQEFVEEWKDSQQELKKIKDMLFD
jgi:putative transposase